MNPTEANNHRARVRLLGALCFYERAFTREEVIGSVCPKHLCTRGQRQAATNFFRRLFARGVIRYHSVCPRTNATLYRVGF